MKLGVAATCQPGLDVLPQSALDSAIAPTMPLLGPQGEFGLVSSAALSALYGRPVLTSPLFTTDIAQLRLPPPQACRIFVPPTLWEGAGTFLSHPDVSVVNGHEHLAHSVTAMEGASPAETAAVVLFSPTEVLSPDFGAFVLRLREKGFIDEQGAVRTLTTAEEGVAFVQELAHSIPMGFDLIDACELLDFGPWSRTKEINATLRCLGMKDLRPDQTDLGSRRGVLRHPFSNRAQKVSFIASKGQKALDKILERNPAFSLATVAQRLIVEAVFGMETLKNETGLRNITQEGVGVVSYILDYLQSVINTLKALGVLQTSGLLPKNDLIANLHEKASLMHASFRAAILPHERMSVGNVDPTPDELVAITHHIW